MDSWKFYFEELLEKLSPYPMGSQDFWILTAISVLGIIVIGKIIVTLLCDSRRGIFFCFLGLMAPWIAAAAGYIATTLYVLPYLNNEMIGTALLWAASVLSLLVALGMLSTVLLGLGIIKTLFASILTYAAVAGLSIFAMKYIDQIADTVEEAPTVLSSDSSPIDAQLIEDKFKEKYGE